MAIHVPINLATEPFRRDRAILVASAAVAFALMVVLGIQVSYIMSQRGESGEIQHTIDRQNSQLSTIAAEQTRLNNTLRRPENAEVLERSLFLNAIIGRKAISWTKIFADLEKVMPYNVHLVSVRLPVVDSQNEVLLDMLIGSKEVLPLLESVRRLEASPQFGATSVQNSMPPSQTDPFYRFHVTVSYAQKL